MPTSRASSRAPLRVLVLVFAALAVSSPFFFRGPACGADFIFHYTSWHDVLFAWRSGIFYPHWAHAANFLAGEPRFVFYPPITWMAGAALGALLPWHAVPIVLNFLIFLGTGLATAALARRFVPATCATVAGCLAMSSGYTLFEAYFHSDFALLTGGFWVPLLLLAYFWQPGPASPRVLKLRVLKFTDFTDRRTLVLAVLLTGSWLSNTPLGLMATYLLCTVGLLSAWQTRSWQPLLRLVPAIALGLGLAGFYLAPATFEQRWVDILALIATPDHQVRHRFITSELLNASDRTRGVIEVAMLALAFAGLALTRRTWLPGKPSQAAAPDLKPDLPTNLSNNPQAAQHRWFILAFLCLAVFFLLLPISYPVWVIVPRLRFLQYPWRWLVVLQAPMAIFFAAALWSFRPRLRHAATAVCALLLLLLIFRWGRSDTRFRACDATSGVFSIAAMDRSLAPGAEGVGGFEEYVTPPSAKDRLIAVGLPAACLVHDPLATLSTAPAPSEPAWYKAPLWSPGLGSCLATYTQTPASSPEHLAINAQTPSAGFLILRLRSYPLWRLQLNGNPVPTRLPSRPDGLLAIPVPQGPVHLTADWTTGPDVLLGRSISLLSLVLALSLAWTLRPRRT